MPIPSSDIAQLSSWVVTVIAPFLPTLWHLAGEGAKKLGEKAVEEVGKEAGKEGFDLAKRLWEKISPRLKESAPAKEAMDELVKNPEDKDSREILTITLRKLLNKDSELLSDVRDLRPQSSISINTATADRGGLIVVGQLGDNANLSANYGQQSRTGRDKE